MSSDHDTHDLHDGDPAPDPHAAEPAVAEPVTPLSAFIWPALIALLVLILIWNPISTHLAPLADNGYDANGRPTPAGRPPATENAVPAATSPPANGLGTVIPLATAAAPAPATTGPAGGGETPPAATATALPVTDTPLPPTAPPPTAPPTTTPAAALPPASGDTQAGAPLAISFGGKSFKVVSSTTSANPTSPDWVFSQDPAAANWLNGTVVNYILGLAYTPDNAALFAAARPADSIRLTRADGEVYTFVVDQVRRVSPADTRLLAQDHPAITLLLLGDPASDRALIQGHFSEQASR
ncbi:MAG TPA: hypothetical protein VKY74_03020 [Chloroflexia bacterium]|nr:hypothetical protein [Chloroflexia bacterium]